MFSCFSPWHGLRRLWKRLVTSLWPSFFGVNLLESQAKSIVIYQKDIPNGSDAPLVDSQAQSGVWQQLEIQVTSSNLGKIHPQAIFAQRLLESLLREAGCVFSVCRNICRQTELCLLVCICLCLSCYCCAGATRTPVIMHMHMEDCKGLRLQTVCLHFFAHSCFSSPWRTTPNSSQTQLKHEKRRSSMEFRGTLIRV